MSEGGITVSKVTTGVFTIQDIQVNVPHQVAVHIPADKACMSRDLHRALGSKILIQLTSTLSMARKPEGSSSNSDRLELENQMLREALQKASAQTEALKGEIHGLEQRVGSMLDQKMDKLLAAMASRPATTVVMSPGGSGSVPEPLSEVVGGEAPMFIPDNLVPKDATVQVASREEVSDGGAVSAAASKLRQIRRGT